VLIISRKINETIKITNDITIKVVRVGKGQVKLGIEAPDHVRVERDDLKKSDKRAS
jgi:carbon storage regulator